MQNLFKKTMLRSHLEKLDQKNDSKNSQLWYAYKKKKIKNRDL